MTVTAPDISMTLSHATGGLRATGGLSASAWSDRAATLAGQPPAASGDFASLMAGASGMTADQREQQVREAANEFVSMAFIMPLMKMSRNDPFKSDLFHGGQGEEAFGKQLDEYRAKQVAPAVSKPLVDAIYDRFKAQIRGGGVDRRG